MMPINVVKFKVEDDDKQKIIDILEEYTALAKTGDLSGIAVTLLLRNGDEPVVRNRWYYCTSQIELLGGVSLLKSDITTSINKD